MGLTNHPNNGSRLESTPGRSRGRGGTEEAAGRSSPKSNPRIEEDHRDSDEKHASKRIKLTQDGTHPINSPRSNQVHHQPRLSGNAQVEREEEVDEDEDEGPMDYITGENLPVELEKYWAQRKRLFSRFDEGIRMDQESWYSVTPEAIAQQIAARSSCNLIVDGFCGAGGNAIQFARTCQKVIAIDKDPNKIRLAKHNSKVYGVSDRIQFICTDFIDWIQAQKPGSIDVIFLSPPWGGMDYLIPTANKMNGDGRSIEHDDCQQGHYYKLDELEPIDGKKLFHLADRITHRVVFYLPRHLDLIDLARLTPGSHHHHPNKTHEDHDDCREGEDDQPPLIEVEENWMNFKCKALTVYFGDLVSATHPI